MAAGQGFKTFATGDVLTAADTNGYLMQGVWVFADAAARDAAVTSPQEGNVCYLKSTDAIMTYSGSAWVAVGGGAAFVGCVASAINNSQSWIANADNILALPTETLDTDNFHNNVVTNSRITIPAGKAGKYAINITAKIGAGVPNYNILKIVKNGTNYNADGLDGGQVSRTENGSNTSILNGSVVMSLAVSDYIEVVMQNAVATGTYNFYCQFSVVYLGA